ncbi:AMP-binding protein [Aquabacterium sp. CECT 9606]|uniref:AMP-binding protein n=1 Tax=Aquabacterium sp. CECT 9606 TaxID=2845822 RepID=UPI001E3BCB41|nr:AMP-binding protein [Aquabacterium sp. CECT 9606]CAH0353225.1 Long-chain-fatty-acid--CoA ligase [Aquabacterium sp. CECT 9606]
MQIIDIPDRPWVNFHQSQPDFNQKILGLADFIEQHASERQKKAAAEYLGATISYAELNFLANKLANALRDRGVQRSETIGLHLPNTPEYLIALVAASKLGCPVTGVSPLLTTPEIEHQLQDAGARFLISMEQVYTTSVAPADGRLSLLRGVFVTSPIGILPKWKQHAAYFSGKLPRPSWKPMIHTATEAFMPAVQNASDAHAYASVAEDETVFIQYTGGTTGKPKGAELTKRNMFANGLQAMSFIGGDSGDTFASAFPLFHQAGLAISLMALRAGARQLLIPNPRDIDFFITQMKKFPPTMLGNVPSLYQMLLEKPAFREIDFSRLRVAFSGAAPFAPEGIRQLEVVVGAGKLCEVYGMTETSPLITINPPGRTKPGTVGIPLPGSDVKIMDAETGNVEMPAGEVGEITTCGPNVMKGYRGHSEATAQSVREINGKRWMYTGDIGFFDAEGYLTICDRAKDMLIVGGYKVFSVEVESKLKELPCIELCALVGLPDPNRPGNDIVKLYVQLSADSSSVNRDVLMVQILDFCRQNMAPYKVPKHIEFMATLPLTPIGKLDKKALRN